MSSIIAIINASVAAIVDLLLLPFSKFSALAGLIAISALSGIFLLFLYGRVSNQEAIRSTKKKIHSYLLEAVLFRHDVRMCLRAQARMFGQGFAYFAYAVPPVLILAIPCILLLAQLNLHYGFRGFKAGETGILKVKVDEEAVLNKMSLVAPSGIEATPALRIPKSNEIFWRVKPVQDSSQVLTVKVGSGPDLKKPVLVGDGKAKIVNSTYKAWWWNLLYPGDKTNSACSSVISELSLSYPEQRYKIFGMHMHWMVVFFLFSFLSGLIGSKALGIEI